MAINRANVAAQIMEHLCTCPEHGYSQPGRYGASGYCDVATDAGTIRVKKGDRDCSSAVCEAWEYALKGTPHEGAITRYHTTYDMRSLFCGTGLFSWEQMSFMACWGDVYLDESSHTAMCLQNDASADVLGEFSIAETGGIDGEPGDQTGWESSVHGYYEAWDGILHCNGGADGGEVSPSAPSGGSSGNLPMPRYRAAVMRGGKLIGLTVYYLTPDPASTGYYAAKYRVHWMGPNAAWGKWEYDDDDDGAGNDIDQVDMIELTICPV